MSKTAHILAVETNLPDFTGYKPCDPMAYLEGKNLWLGHRPHLETLDWLESKSADKPVMLQIIPYITVQHEGKYGAYVRPDVGNETRLHGKLSIGVGGHVDLADVCHEDSVINLKATLTLSTLREMEEELGLKLTKDDISWTGLIMQDQTSVDRVHLGVVGTVTLNDEKVQAIQKTEEIEEFRFIDPSTALDDMAEYNIEAWTHAILETTKGNPS